MGEVPKSRQRFDVWLMEFLTPQLSSSFDTSLQIYIKVHRVVVRDSLLEPLRISDARTRFAIFEESGLFDPANSRNEGLR